ncbi:MAG: TIGR01212 family radical SAM protein [Bacilli bacterium]|nr:TIGR01212 family radical SAM protein [Bacilli bacterium]
MKKTFEYTLDNKRYHTLNYYYKNKYNLKIAKISLNGNFTCPNKDGKISKDGCIYCSKYGSGDFSGNINKSITEQFYEIKEIMDKKWENTKYIAYFQANTNTYAPLNILKQKYEEALNIKDVIGINIATRPDCIEDDVLNYLCELNKKTNLTIEIGLQTIHDKTSKLINRGHDLKCFENTLYKLRNKNIDVVVHIINGLPYETKEMMINTVKYLSKLDIQGIKIHMLYILKDTTIHNMYKKEKFHILTKKEYVNIVCDQLQLLPKKIVIHRITGDPKKEDLISPKWLLKKFCVLNEIDKELLKRNTYQGFNLE